jgi:translocation and assembly module TamB
MTHRWRRLLLWIGVAVASLVVIAVAGIWLALRSGPIHDDLLHMARTRASAAIGALVEIGNFQIHLHGVSPAIYVENLAIPGAAPFPSPPLLRLPRARIRVQITSLIPFRWHLRSIQLNRPVVHLFIGPGGRTNLPHPPHSSGSGANPFQLAIGRMVVRGGRVVVNARAIPLNADLRNLQLQAAYAGSVRGYRGHLSFADSTLRVSSLPPLTQAFYANFLLTPSRASLTAVRWSTQGATLTAVATLRDYGNPSVDARYRLQLQTATLRRRLRVSALPRGAIAFTGVARYRPGSGFSAQGEFSSSRLVATVSGIDAPISGLQGQYRYAGGTLSVTGIHAGILGGALRASLLDRGLLAGGATHLDASLQRARLEEAAAFAGSARRTLGQLGIRGRLDAAVHAQWRGAFRHVSLAAHAALRATLARAHQPRLPLEGTVRATFAGGILRLAPAEVRTSQSYFRASGTLAARSSLRIAAGSRNLTELEAIAREIVPVLTGRPLAPLGLSGAGTFQGAVTGPLLGSPPALRIAGRLDLAPFAFRGSRWRSLAFTLAADPSRLVVQNLHAAAAGGGAVAASFSLGLHGFAPRSASALQASLDIRALPLAAIAAPLGRSLPLAGLLTAQAHVVGTLAHPQGSGTASLATASFHAAGATQRISSASVSFTGSPAALNANLRVLLPAGLITASGRFAPSSGAYQFSLQAPRLVLRQLAWLQARHVAVSGLVALVASGQGTLAAPAGQLSLTSARLVVARRPITAIHLQARLRANRVSAQLAATALDAPLHAQADVSLSSDLPAVIRLDAPAVPLAPLIAAFEPALAGRIQGRTAVEANLNGPLGQLAALRASVTIPTLELRYSLPATMPAPGVATTPRALTLAAAAPLHVSLAQGVLTLASADFTGTDTNLTLQAHVPLHGAGLTITARGQVGLRLAQLYLAGTNVAGEASLNVAVGGSLAHPVVGGQIAIANASLSSPTLPLAVTNGHGLLRLSAQRLEIANFTADAGGGIITASGGLAFRPALRFDFGLAARRLGLRYPGTVREEVNADLALIGAPRAAQLNGRVQVTRVSVLPGFDFTSFVTQLSSASPAVSAPGSFTQSLALNLAITTPNRIAIATPSFSLNANAAVNVRGTAAEPVVLGRVNLDRGDLIFNGQRFQLSGGTLDFANPTRTEPVVNVSATTTIDQYNLNLAFQGPASNLRTTYTSNPPLPPADIIHLLAFGSTSEASSANSLPGNLAAENLVAGAVSSQLTGRVQKLAGISQLSVDPVLRGANQNAGARITVQQRISGNLFVTFSTDTTGTTRNVVEIQYSFTPRVSLTAVRGQNGGFGVSARFKKVW